MIVHYGCPVPLGFTNNVTVGVKLLTITIPAQFDEHTMVAFLFHYMVYFACDSTLTRNFHPTSLSPTHILYTDIGELEKVQEY